MSAPFEADEFAIVVGRVRRFLTSWLILIVSLVAASIVVGGVLELIALVRFSPGRNDGQIEDHPLVLSVAWAYGAAVAGLVFGAPFVLLRRHIVRPDFPFLRAGYLAVVAAPFGLYALAWGSEAGWLALGIYVQGPLLIAAVIYVALARRLSLFAPEERPRLTR